MLGYHFQIFKHIQKLLYIAQNVEETNYFF